MAKTDPLDHVYTIEWPRTLQGLILPAGRWQVEGDHLVAQMFRSELIDTLAVMGALTKDEREHWMKEGAKHTKAVTTPAAIFAPPHYSEQQLLIDIPNDAKKSQLALTL